MKVRAIRNICVGVNQHLQAGDTTDMDEHTFIYFSHIRAVEKVVEPATPVPSVEVKPPEKSGTKEK
jgi:hypothetical protein